jgi:YjbR
MLDLWPPCREQSKTSVRPGYHQNKRHWNPVERNGSIDDSELRSMIHHSYEFVAANLPRAIRVGSTAADREVHTPEARGSVSRAFIGGPNASAYEPRGAGRRTGNHDWPG